jgi:hypothetical protein
LDDIEGRFRIGGADVYQTYRRFAEKLKKEKNVLTKFNKKLEGNLSKMKP